MNNDHVRQSAVIVSQYGAFHGQQGAEAAHALGALQKFFTVRPYGGNIPPDKISNLEWLDAPARLLNQANKRALHSRWVDEFNFGLRKGTRVLFDQIVSRSITKHTKIFHAYSSFQERCWDACETYGVKKIADWGIAHPKFLIETWEREAKTLGLTDSPSIKAQQILAELEQMDIVYVPSRFVKQTFLDFGYKRDHLRINPYGVDGKLFYPLVSSGAVRERFSIVTAGMLGWRKGTYYLLEAVRRLKQEGIDCDVYLMGFPDEDFGKKFLSRYQDVVTHVGGVSHAAIVDYYRLADVFVLPSLAEGQARVVLEAMACATPCIVTANTGCADVVRDGINGFVVPVRDSEAIADRIRLLYRDQARLRDMGRKARQAVEQQTWHRYRQTLMTDYQTFI
ncbi:MAG TPA: glycosyltransferase family 4 protein [Candidatus Bathyarchaeia archaeon]|nr:glycosyltransferase family 4 protein [Candidatus Bathyarchaeia archaeon]